MQQPSMWKKSSQISLPQGFRGYQYKTDFLQLARPEAALECPLKSLQQGIQAFRSHVRKDEGT